MKEPTKKFYLFNVIIGAINVLLIGSAMLSNERLILKVLFVIALVFYIVLLVSFFIERKRWYK